MHAQYVRIWLLGGLTALVLAIPMALAKLPAHATMLVVGVSFLSLTLTLGLLPAFVRRDWPSPVFAISALVLIALALPFAREARLFSALAGASILVGAAQPLALLLSPPWKASDADARFSITDRVALAAIVSSLLSIAAGGILLIALPRGLPGAGFAMLLVGGAFSAAFGALLFVLPRQAGRPLPLAILGAASLVFIALSTLALALALWFPLQVDARPTVAGVAVALALAVLTILRSPKRPPLAAASLALAVLAGLALLVATIYGAPNELIPIALYAFVAFDLILLASALIAAAPLLVPGRAPGKRWPRWAPALLIAALFLYTPALQLGRSIVPATILGAVGLVALVVGLAPLSRWRAMARP